MQKVVLITSDTRLGVQLRTWLRSFPNEPFFEAYRSIEEFDEKYSQPIKLRDALIHEIDVSADVDDETRRQELQIEAETSPIRLLIVDLDAIPSRPLDWIVAARHRLFGLGHISEATETSHARIMVLGYDDPHLKPDQFRHELIDDMLIKPLDQQLILQKIELLLADSPDISPTFLFRAQAEGPIEIGKDAIIDEISDFAISVRNPTPLADGVFAQIHSRVFGEGYTGGRIWGRVYASIRHPQFENLWMVRFTLFGLASDQLAELRKFIRARAVPGRLRPVSSTNRKKDKLPPRYRIAVIDLDRDVLTMAQTTIEENFDRTSVSTFTSYTRFLAGLIKISDAASMAMDSHSSGSQEGPIGTTENQRSLESPGDGANVQQSAMTAPNARMDLILDEKFAITAIQPTVLASQLFIGMKGEDLIARGSAWIDVIPKADHDDFLEFLNYTTSSGRAVTSIRLIDTDGQFIYAEVRGQAEVQRSDTGDGAEKKVVKLEFRPIEPKVWMEMNRLVSRGQTPDSFRFDAIFIDAGLMRGPCEAWLGSLHSALVKAKVIDISEPIPRIIVLSDETSQRTPASFVHRGIADFIFKSIDRKLLTDKLSACLPQLTRSTPLDGSLFTPCELTAQICKTVNLIELSEYGLTVRHPTPFKPRIFMRFFANLFGETSEGVIGRCVQSRPIRSVDDELMFNCQFIFFGASDELHKRIRNWIREDYVHKKVNN